MTILLLFLSPALFVLFWIIRFQIFVARRRQLVDTYGVDTKKLGKMSYKGIKRY